MDDKWVIFMDGDSLWFYRSWTLKCVFQVRFTRVGDGWAVSMASVSAEFLPIGRFTDVDSVAELLRFLIERLLLGKDVPFPTPVGLEGRSRAAHQHSLIGWGRSRSEIEEDD